MLWPYYSFIFIFTTKVGAATISRRDQPGTTSYNQPVHFRNLVTFGDSYTDENGLNYLTAHGGAPPPPGTVLPMNLDTASGGITWDRWVSIYSHAKLYDYAVAGAVCSSELVYRYYAAINGPFPGVLEYQVPAFVADVNYINASTGTNTFFKDRTADNTIYAMWIGTNDLGVDGYLTHSQEDEKPLVAFTDCVFDAFDGIYNAGGRHFILMNTVPLQLSPLYGLPEAGGVKTSKYWPDKPSNLTAISDAMLALTTSANMIFNVQAPYLLYVTHRYPGATITMFDVHSLMTDIYCNPELYLNGTQGTANSQTPYYLCDDNYDNCVTAPGSSDGYMWYDELHPSSRTDQIIAKEFINVVEGESKYASYW